MTAATETLARPDVSLRRSATLLVLSFLPVVPFMVLAHVAMPESSSWDMTAAQLADMRPAWVLLAVLWALPWLIGAAGLAALQRALGSARLVTHLAVVGAISMTAYVVAQVVVLGSDAKLVADMPAHTVGVLCSLAATWVLVVATLVMCRGLITARVVRRPAQVILVLTALYLLLDLLTYVPALVGSAELADTVGMPPMVIPLFWAVLGGFALRSPVPSDG